MNRQGAQIILSISLLLCFSQLGCKIQRSKLRSNTDTSVQAKWKPPKTLRGSFVVNHKADGEKTFPLYFSYFIDFSASGRSAKISTCLDGDSGLKKSGSKISANHDKELLLSYEGGVPSSQNGASPESEKIEHQLPTCRVSFEDGTKLNLESTIEEKNSIKKESSGENSIAVNSTSDTISNPKTQGVDSNKITQTSEATAPSKDDNLYVFQSEPNKFGKPLKLTFRANNETIQLETVDYFGSPGWSEKTEEVASY
jgi:hypothetical protein